MIKYQKFLKKLLEGTRWEEKQLIIIQEEEELKHKSD
jgi:hypothetical protein